MPVEPEPPYRLIYRGVARDSLRSLADKAMQQGIGPQLGAVLQRMENRLRSDPLTFGEPLTNLRLLDLQMRAAGTEYFYIRFAVDANRRIVYVLHCVPSARLGD